MADWMLAGNGTVCPRCEGRGLVADRGVPRAAVCPACAGLGRVPVPADDIVAAMIAEARAAGRHG